MKRLTVRLPGSIHRQLKALAERKGVSMNRMATIAIAEKAAAFLTAGYLEKRAERGDRTKFEAALATVPKVEPDDENRFPDTV